MPLLSRGGNLPPAKITYTKNGRLIDAPTIHRFYSLLNYNSPHKFIVVVEIGHHTKAVTTCKPRHSANYNLSST